jgi:N-acyl-D-amino-acid deacylase
VYSSKHFSRVFIIALCYIALAGCGSDVCESDLMLSDCYVIDGTGGPGYRADIYIRGDKIYRMTDPGVGDCTARETIDASKYVVTPGFIDVHAHGNPELTPGFENFLAMGVTTIFLGQDGASPWVRELKSYIVNEDSLRTGVNVAYMAGHGTLRRGSGVDDTEANEREIERLSDLVRNVMEAGCFGVSTGLEYLPGSHADKRELTGLAKAVGKNDGMIMSHLRSEDDDVLDASLKELINQGQYTRVHVAHLKSVYGKGSGRAEEILSIFDDAHESDVHLTADMYPYLASYTGISIVFPPWAKTKEKFEYVRVSRENELRHYLYTRVMARNGPGATLFGNPPYTGMTLKQVARESGSSFVDVLMRLGPESISAAYFVMDQELQDRLFLAPYVMVGSDGSSTMHHPRGHGTFAKVLRYYVFETHLLTLPEAIHKMTGLSATTVNLQNRGRIEEGFYADLNIIDTAIVRDMATFSEPHLMARGFKYTIVNGKIARTDQKDGVVLNGRFLSSLD